MDKEKTPPPSPTDNKTTPKKKGAWFQKIPHEILLSPPGVILVIFAFIIEVIDWIPIPPPFDQIIEIPLELFFLLYLVIITKMSFKSIIIPFIIERIPLISDILPTWLIRLFF